MVMSVVWWCEFRKEVLGGGDQGEQKASQEMPRSMNDNCLIAHYGQHINDFRKILDIQLGRRKRSESSPPIPYPAPRYGAVQIQYRCSTLQNRCSGWPFCNNNSDKKQQRVEMRPASEVLCSVDHLQVVTAGDTIPMKFSIGKASPRKTTVWWTKYSTLTRSEWWQLTADSVYLNLKINWWIIVIVKDPVINVFTEGLKNGKLLTY